MTTLQASIDALISAPGVVLAMQTFTGGEVQAETATTRDPGARFPRPVAAPPTLGNITTGVDYDEAKHGALLSVLRSHVGTDIQYSVAHYRRDGNGNVNGASTYTGQLIRVTPPAGNTNGGADKATLELEFVPGGVTG